MGSNPTPSALSLLFYLVNRLVSLVVITYSVLRCLNNPHHIADPPAARWQRRPHPIHGDPVRHTASPAPCCAAMPYHAAPLPDARHDPGGLPERVRTTLMAEATVLRTRVVGSVTVPCTVPRLPGLCREWRGIFVREATR